MSHINKNPQNDLPSHEVPEYKGDSVFNNKKSSYLKPKTFQPKKAIGIVNPKPPVDKREHQFNTFSPSHQPQQMNMSSGYRSDNYHQQNPAMATPNMPYANQGFAMNGYPNGFQYPYNPANHAMMNHQMAPMQMPQDRANIPPAIKAEKVEVEKKLNFNDHISQEVARNISVNFEFTDVFDSIKKNSEKTIVSLGELIKAAEDQIIQENKNIEKQTKSDELGVKIINLKKQKDDCDSKIKELDAEYELLLKEEEEFDKLLKEQEQLLKAKEVELENKIQKVNSSPSSSAGDWSSLSSGTLNKNKGKPVTIVLDSSKTSAAASEETKEETKKPANKNNKLKQNVKNTKSSASSSEKDFNLTPAQTETSFYSEKENFGKKGGMFLLEYMINPKKSYTFIEERLKTFTPPKFMNNSNICFMNSVLQSLLSIPEFLNLLYGLSRSSDYDIEIMPIAFHTWNFLYECMNTTNTYKSWGSLGNVDESSNVSYDTSLLFDHLISLDKFKTLKKGRQEDAEEYLTLVLDSLSEEFISLIEKLTFKDVEEFMNNNIQKESEILTYLSNFVNNKNCAWLNEPLLGDSLKNRIEINSKNQSGWEVTSSEKQEIRYTEFYPTPITSIFGCLMMSELKKNKSNCKKGEFPISITYDPHLVLPLNLQKSDKENSYSIKGMLEKWASEEVLEIDNNEVKKINKFHNLPNVLIIQIKRFNYHLQTESLNAVDAYKHENKVNGKTEKLNDYIDFDFEFDIPASCLQDQAIQNQSYSLKSIVYHSGSDTHSGHYTADSMNNKTGWFRCNDVDIQHVTKKDVLELGKKKVNTPYILFYVRN